MATIAESREFVGLRLAMTFFGDQTKVARREGEPKSDDDDGGGRQSQGDARDRVHGAGHQDRETGDGGDARQHESRRALFAHGIERSRFEPHRHRHEHDGGRPRDGVEIGADLGRADAVGEEIERVAEDVETDARGQEEPRHGAASRQEHGPADDQREQQQVTDRIREVGRGRERAAAGGVHDVVERERGAE